MNEGEDERDAHESDEMREFREVRREARRVAREAARQARHELRRSIRMVGPTVVGLGEVLGGGEAFSETVRRDFAVSGMPSLRVRNVSGGTRISVGAPGEVRVTAVKTVHASSADRAKRLLENVEVVMEQDGGEITIEPRLFEQERSWIHLFRGPRFRVDLQVTVPRETRLEARTVSGELEVKGLRGPIEVQSVSGEIDLADLQGPLRLRTVSGDARCSDYAGKLEANTVSGDLRFERCRLRACDVVTVSGDVVVSGEVAGSEDGRIKTVSGDVDLAFGGAYAIAFKTVSGDLDSQPRARITSEGRRDKRVMVGRGGPELKVKTVSGDLRLGDAGDISAVAPEPPAAPDVEATAPIEPPVAPATLRQAAMEVLERLARGELSVEDAAAALDETRQRGVG